MMYIHRIYCCSPLAVSKSGMPVSSAAITYWDIIGATTGVEAMVLFRSAASQFEYLAWEYVDEEASFDCNYAYDYIKRALGRDRKDGQPMICPEIWFDGDFDSTAAWKITLDLCRGIR